MSQIRRGRFRVWLDGRDVTSYCTAFDTRRGVVRLLLRDLGGHVVLHPNGTDAVRYERRGRVKVQRLAVAS